MFPSVCKCPMPLNHNVKGEILFNLGASYDIENIIFKGYNKMGLHVQIFKEYWELCSFENQDTIYPKI